MKRLTFQGLFRFGDMLTPTPEFRENSHERAARSPTNRSQRFDPPSPGTLVHRAGHAPVVTISVIQHSTHIAMRTFSNQQRRCTQLGSSQETAVHQPHRALDHMQPVRCSSQQRPAVSPTFGVSTRYVAVAGQRSN